MQLSKSVDIEAPCAAVYAALADIDHWERMALRREVDVQRLGHADTLAPGLAWRAAFPFRGGQREVMLRVDRAEPGKALGISLQGKALQAVAQVDLAEMAPRRTRVTVAVEVSARTLAARLFLQSLRLAPGRVRQKFESRIGMLVQEIEARVKGAR